MKIATLEQFKLNEGIESGECLSCGAEMNVGTDDNSVPYAVCPECGFTLRQTDDYTL